MTTVRRSSSSRHSGRLLTLRLRRSLPARWRDNGDRTPSGGLGGFVYPRNQPHPRQRRPKGRATDCSRPATPVREGWSPFSRSCNPNSFSTKAGVRGHRKTRQRTLRGGETRVGYLSSELRKIKVLTSERDARARQATAHTPQSAGTAQLTRDRTQHHNCSGDGPCSKMSRLPSASPKASVTHSLKIGLPIRLLGQGVRTSQPL